MEPESFLGLGHDARCEEEETKIDLMEFGNKITDRYKHFLNWPFLSTKEIGCFDFANKRLFNFYFISFLNL